MAILDRFYLNPKFHLEITFLNISYFFVLFCLTLKKTLSFADQNNNWAHTRMRQILLRTDNGIYYIKLN